MEKYDKKLQFSVREPRNFKDFPKCFSTSLTELQNCDDFLGIESLDFLAKAVLSYLHRTVDMDDKKWRFSTRESMKLLE